MHRFGWAVASLLALLSLEAVIAQSAPAPNAQPSQVNFRAKTSALDAIIAIGLATHSPIGILPGQDTTALCKTRYEFDLTDLDASSALLSVAHQMQYSWYEEDGVMILRAPDLTPRQAELLDHRFANYPAQSKRTVHLLTARLAEWLWSSQHPDQGYGGSILDRPGAPEITLQELKDVTPSQIANRIVTNGSRGMWISQIRPNAADEMTDYQIILELYRDPNQLQPEISCAW
jgi:hypothetical protein